MYTRTFPYLSRIRERKLLTGPFSTKKTYHIVLDIQEADFPFKVGDSIGVLPQNDPREVDAILAHIKTEGKKEVYDARAKANTTIRELLLFKANLSRVNSSFLKHLLENGGEKESLEPLLLSENKAKLNEYLHSHSLLEILTSHKAKISSEELAKLLMPLLPRFYSIANSPHVFPGEIHLTVAYVQYEQEGRVRRGIGSHYLCDLAEIGKSSVPIYVQPSQHFTLPVNPEESIILVGPGTGIAPYRAFLQERLFYRAEGKNWLFFGERNRSSDFYYGEFLTELESQGRLRLDLAFSRDQKEKIYVQHKMYQERKTLWEWICAGSYFYVCGDAEKMAKDVDATLHKIVQEEGGISEEEARLFVKKMRVEKRYLTDVY